MRFTILFLLLAIYGQNALAQEVGHVDGGRFSKTVEYNTIRGVILVDENGNESYGHNVDGKTRFERLFFGDFNAPAEYVFSPSYQTRESVAGVRLVKSAPDSFILEVKYITNLTEVLKELDGKYPARDVTIGEMKTMSHAEYKQIAEHNGEVYRKAEKERFDLYEVGSLSFPLHHLGDKLYEKMVSLIGGFKAEGGAAVMSDGYTATFRCVVGDEVWSLTIHEPQKRALQMSDFYRQIIEDARSGAFDESKYARMLETMEF